MKNKFEEFFYNVDKKIYLKTAYWDLYDRNYQEAISKYEGHMFCPLCEQAPITVAKGAQRRYLKVDRTDMHKHNANCSYRLQVGNKKETSEFYKDLDKTDIKNRLRSCMNKMLKNVRETNLEGRKITNGKKNTQEEFLNFTTNSRNMKKHLPHKNFTFGILNDDLDIQKIFYGKSSLYIHQYIPDGEIEVKVYYLKVLEQKSKKQIFDIAISKYIYEYLKTDFDEIPRCKEKAKNYHLCYSGIMQKSKYSYKSKLIDSRLIIIEKDIG